MFKNFNAKFFEQEYESGLTPETTVPNYCIMQQLGIPQERIAQRLGMERETVGKHLVKTSELKKLPNELLTKGFFPNTNAEKLGWPEPLVWAFA